MSPAPVYIHDDGAGDPVLLLHAFPLDATMWDPQVVQLRERHRCLRPDFWGCGASPMPSEYASLEDFAATVVDGLASMGVHKFGVVGMSMGGYAAFAILRHAPERVSHLVLASTRAGADSDAGKADRIAMARAVLSEGVDVVTESLLTRLLSPMGQTDVEITTLVRERMLHATPQGVAACQYAMAERPDSTSMLASIEVPTLVIAGGADAIIPLDQMRAMSNAIPGATLRIIEDAGHLANLEAPGVFNDMVDELLDVAR